MLSGNNENFVNKISIGVMLRIFVETSHAIEYLFRWNIIISVSISKSGCDFNFFAKRPIEN